MPFIAGTLLNYYNNNYNSDIINNIIRNIQNKFYGFVELSNLESNEDGMHFTTNSVRIGADLYFNEYKKLIKNMLEKGIE